MALTKVKGEMIAGNIDASQLSGTLPALDAANLTNVDAEKVLKGNGAPTTNINPSGGVGTLYVNTANGEILICTNATTDGNVWMNAGVGEQNVIPPGPMVATGGNEVVTSATHKYHIFTSSGQLVVATATNGAQWENTLEVLVVAGGGSGGKGEFGAGGGGGAGGYQVFTAQPDLLVGTYDVIVGAGGVGVNTNAHGIKGNNSSFKHHGGVYTYPDMESEGGGGGQGSSSLPTGNPVYDRDGGSGGAFGQGIPGQGYRGGTSGDNYYGSGPGGGGASQYGEYSYRYRTNAGGHGGNGKNDHASWCSDIASAGGQTYGYDTGYFAGGGGGGSNFGNSSAMANGGLGGGGHGNTAKVSITFGLTESQHVNWHGPGLVNSGGGGGACQVDLHGNDANWTIPHYGHDPVKVTGESGGSGIVIIRYPL